MNLEYKVDDSINSKCLIKRGFYSTTRTKSSQL